MDEIIASYTEAEYCVDGLEEQIKIGESCRAVESLLDRSKSDTWSFITAFNPLSVELAENENNARNESLANDLSGYRILKGEARDPRGNWGPEKSFLILGISLRKAKRLGSKYGQRAIVFSRTGKPAELVETLHSTGNRELLRLKKAAFICSRTAPPETRARCLEWVREVRPAGKCVISGFHSAVEREVLIELLKGGQQVIQVLARGLKRRVEPELVQALKDGSVLVITPFDEKVRQPSAATAAVRNALVVDLADEVFCGLSGDSGSLGPLLKASGKPVEFV